MDLLDSVQQSYPDINNAAGEFLGELTGKDIKKDIVLSAEMAGLMLLRQSSVNLLKIPSGVGILGAVADEAYAALNRFLYGWAISNGLDPNEIDLDGIPNDAKNYLPEVTQFEQAFYRVCEKNRIDPGFFPFVAATAAMKLVAAGKMLGLVPAGVGQALTMFHVLAGSKTVPYPPTNETRAKPAGPMAASAS